MNVCCATGRLTKDPVVFKGGCSFTLAVNAGKDQTAFIPCKAFKMAADIITEHGYQGVMFAVNGNFKTDSWKSKDGQNRSALNLYVQFAEVMREPGDGQQRQGGGQQRQQGGRQQGYQNQGGYQQRPQARPQQGYQQQAQDDYQDESYSGPFGADDIPF